MKPASAWAPSDRVAAGVRRWESRIHHGKPVMAALLGQAAGAWDARTREAARQRFRQALGDGDLNMTEYLTLSAILTAWDAQSPGAKTACIVAHTELAGYRFPPGSAVLLEPPMIH